MKILVFAHRLEYGGTQVNAIELSAALRDLHGHEVVLFATPGPMQRLVDEKRLRLLPAPDARVHPSPARMRALREAVRRERPDVMHVWDWWQCLDAYVSVHLPMRVPMLVSDMMMELTQVLPKGLWTTFGTPMLVEQARAAGRRHAQLMLPPVDVRLNAPGTVDEAPFRRRHRLRDDDIHLVTVSRLADFMKSDSLVRSIEVVGRLGLRHPLRLLIVGDGAARTRLQRQADRVNADLGREAVTLTGAMLDPRPAYQAADIVIGMGGSALRGMAYAKPLVVVGEHGFATPLNAETAPLFLHQGLYGWGDGDPGAHRFEAQLGQLIAQRHRHAAMGRFNRAFVERHFSLEAVSTQLAQWCACAAADAPALRATAADALRTAAVYLRERRFLTPSADPAAQRS